MGPPFRYQRDLQARQNSFLTPFLAYFIMLAIRQCAACVNRKNIAKETENVKCVPRIFGLLSSDVALRHSTVCTSCWTLRPKCSGLDPTAFRYRTSSFLSTLASAHLWSNCFLWIWHYTYVQYYTRKDAIRLRCKGSVPGK